MAKRSRPQTIEYAFRFAKGTNAEQSRMVEMIRVNLDELVKQVILTHNGEEIVIDGFRLREAPAANYELAKPVVQEPPTASSANNHLKRSAMSDDSGN